MSALTVVPAQTELETKALSVPDQANALVVRDQASYDAAALFLRDTVCGLIAEVHEAYDSVVNSAHTTWQEALAKRKKYLAPLETAKLTLSGRIGAYEIAQRRAKEEAEKQAREAAARHADESLEEQLEAAEASGASAQEVRAILETPVALPKPVIPNTHQRMKGLVSRASYEAVVTDLRALCKAVAEGKCPTTYVQPNMPALNAAARAQGKEIARFVPGVQAQDKTSVATTGRKG